MGQKGSDEVRPTAAPSLLPRHGRAGSASRTVAFCPLRWPHAGGIFLLGRKEAEKEVRRPRGPVCAYGIPRPSRRPGVKCPAPHARLGRDRRDRTVRVLCLRFLPSWRFLLGGFVMLVGIRLSSSPRAALGDTQEEEQVAGDTGPHRQAGGRLVATREVPTTGRDLCRQTSSYDFLIPAASGPASRGRPSSASRRPPSIFSMLRPRPLLRAEPWLAQGAPSP